MVTPSQFSWKIVNVFWEIRVLVQSNTFVLCMAKLDLDSWKHSFTFFHRLFNTLDWPNYLHTVSTTSSNFNRVAQFQVKGHLSEWFQKLNPFYLSISSPHLKVSLWCFSGTVYMLPAHITLLVKKLSQLNFWKVKAEFFLNLGHFLKNTTEGTKEMTSFELHGWFAAESHKKCYRYYFLVHRRKLKITKNNSAACTNWCTQVSKLETNGFSSNKVQTSESTWRIFTKPHYHRNSQSSNSMLKIQFFILTKVLISFQQQSCYQLFHPHCWFYMPNTQIWDKTHLRLQLYSCSLWPHKGQIWSSALTCVSPPGAGDWTSQFSRFVVFAPVAAVTFCWHSFRYAKASTHIYE